MIIYSCDMCGKAVKQGELRQILADGPDLCQPCHDKEYDGMLKLCIRIKTMQEKETADFFAEIKARCHHNEGGVAQ